MVRLMNGENLAIRMSEGSGDGNALQGMIQRPVRKAESPGCLPGAGITKNAGIKTVFGGMIGTASWAS